MTLDFLLNFSSINIKKILNGLLFAFCTSIVLLFALNSAYFYYNFLVKTLQQEAGVPDMAVVRILFKHARHR